jgi:hypothetical protein
VRAQLRGRRRTCRQTISWDFDINESFVGTGFRVGWRRVDVFAPDLLSGVTLAVAGVYAATRS